MLLKRGIDLDDYAVENGKEIKKEIDTGTQNRDLEKAVVINYSNC